MASPRPDWLETRTSLLRRLRDGTATQGWEEFFDAYGPVIHAIALKSGVPSADVEDVVQETLVAAAKALRTFRYDRRKGRFKSWLLTVARHRIVDCLRKRGREERRNQPPPDDSGATPWLERIPDESVPDLVEICDREWREGVYRMALERLRARISPGQYQIFDLVVAKGWSVEDVVRKLGVSPNQVYVAKHRVSEALREELQQWEDGEGLGKAAGGRG